MPIPAEEVAAILQDRLRKSGEHVIAIPWSEFYKINQIDKFRPERSEQIRKLCLDEHGIIFAHGDRVVIAARDSKFSGG
jgi:hypothetical protein